MMTIKKIHAAGQSYGRGSDNYRTPAIYGIFNEAGKKVGEIQGSSYQYMEKPTWEVIWFSPSGMPRSISPFLKTFAVAKAWAQAWDGRGPAEWDPREPAEIPAEALESQLAEKKG